MAGGDDMMRPSSPMPPIAITGMAVRLPRVDSLDEYARVIAEGRECITDLTVDDLKASGVPPEVSNAASYVRRRPVLENYDRFDHELFGISPTDASLIDPQHRLFLECAWAALESGVCDPERFDGRIGVYAGCDQNTYLGTYLKDRSAVPVGDYQLYIDSDKDFVATRVAYHLNLKGPAIGIQTACSTSLVAVHTACGALALGDCDAALAGGVALQHPMKSGYLHQEGMILSADGRCRPFDSRSNGTLVGSGACVLLLRRLEDAVRARDHVFAVIAASCLNNDGGNKIAYTAPSLGQQRDVIRCALERSGLPIEAIGYVEAHGTATALGDSVELRALTEAFRAAGARVGTCALGSVKANMGHLSNAAGAAGLIKTALCLRGKFIPPSPYLTLPNPRLKLEESPFYIPLEQQPWTEPQCGARSACVSSFGIGGTNAHVVLEEAPSSDPRLSSHISATIVPVSSNNRDGLRRNVDRVVEEIRARASSTILDHAYSNAIGRRRLRWRTYVEVSDVAGDGADRAASSAEFAETANGESCVVFLFPGQGQDRSLGADLYRTCDFYRDLFECCRRGFQSRLGIDVGGGTESSARSGAAARGAHSTLYEQPFLFSVQYAAASLLLHLGVRPTHLAAHSIGAYAMAALGGVFSLDEALDVVAMRATLCESTPEGAMVVLFGDERLFDGIADPGIALAAINRSDVRVYSGSPAAVSRLIATAGARGLKAKRLPVSRAFHGREMDDIRPDFEAGLSHLGTRRTAIPFFCSTTGSLITSEAALDPSYWGRHLTDTVDFAATAANIATLGVHWVIEMSDRPALSNLVPAGRSTSPARHVALFSSPGEDAQWSRVGKVVGEAWSRGADVRWDRYYGPSATKVPLHAYSFAPTRHHLPRQERGSATARPANGSVGLLQRVTWQRYRRIEGEAPAAGGSDGVPIVRLGVRVDSGEATALLNRVLDADRNGPAAVVLLMPRDLATPADGEAVFGGLVALARTLAGRHLTTMIRCLVVTEGAYAIGGEGITNRYARLAEGVVAALNAETGRVRGIVVDVDRTGAGQLEELAATLSRPGILEDALNQCGTALALRSGVLWYKSITPIQSKAAEQNLPKAANVLITGGLGGLGFSLGKHFLQSDESTRVHLLGRSLTKPTDAHDRKAARLRMLGSFGDRVMYSSVELANGDSLADVLDGFERKHGPYDWVIHAAGVASGSILLRVTDEEIQEVLAPKVRGTSNLVSFFADRQATRMVLFSSLASLFSGAGQAPYAAGNAFLDGFAEDPGRCTGIQVLNWDTWTEAGMSVDVVLPESLESWRKEMLSRGIDTGTGIRQFLAAADLPEPQIAVSPQDLERRDRSRGLLVEPRAASPRPLEVSRPSDGQEVDLVARLRELWRTYLGVERIDDADDFFRLGGHSLYAVSISNELSDAFGIEFDHNLLYDASTFSAFVAAVRRSMDADGATIGARSIVGRF